MIFKILRHNCCFLYSLFTDSSAELPFSFLFILFSNSDLPSEIILFLPEVYHLEFPLVWACWWQIQFFICLKIPYVFSWKILFRVNYTRLTFLSSVSVFRYHSLSSGFHYYCWETNCQANYSSLKVIFLFSSGYSQDFSLSFVFCSFINKSLGVDLLFIILLGNHSTSWICKLVPFITHENSQLLLLQIVPVPHSVFPHLLELHLNGFYF